MEEDNKPQSTEDEGLKILLNPEYYKKLKQQEAQQKIELTDEEKAEIDKQMSDPLRTSSSQIGHFIQDYLEHPEKSKWYRENVLFPTIEKRYFWDKDDDNPGHWNVEIPILSGSF